MVAYTLQFVDSIAASPTVRLDLMAEPWGVQSSTEFGMPELRRAAVSTLLADGERYPAAAYGNRLITLVVKILNASDDDTAAALQSLMWELDRPTNILRYQPGTTEAVFFRTFRCGPDSVRWDPFLKEITCTIPADFAALGEKVVLPAVTVYNDPAGAATTVASDTFGRTVSSGWGSADTGQAWTTSGGSASDYSVSSGLGRHSLGVVDSHRSTVLGLTLADVEAVWSVQTPVVASGAQIVGEWLGRYVDAGNHYRFEAGFQPGGTVDIRIRRMSGGTGTILASLASALASYAVNVPVWVRCHIAGPALLMRVWADGSPEPTTWQLSTTDTSHASGGVGFLSLLAAGNTNALPVEVRYDNLQVSELPPASQSTVDAGRMCFDVTGVKGDMETPLFLRATGVPLADSGRTVTAIAVRRRGSPSSVPFVLQAEAMTPAVDTALAASTDPVMSGSGQNYMRVTFATDTAMVTRIQTTAWPVTADVDARGTYRVFVRYRKSADTMQIRALYYSSGSLVTSDTVTVTKPGPRYVDLGLLQIPSGSDPVHDGYSGTELPVAGVQIYLQAARTSGTGTLDIDAILFVPADDRLTLVKWPADAGTTFVLDAARSMVYQTDSGGTQVETSAPPELAGDLPMISPGVTNRVYWLLNVGMTSLDADSISNSTSITPYYWPRYKIVRPVGS